jgi:hypothetical protein
MNYYRSVVLMTALLFAPQVRAEFLQIDLSIFGMD